MAIAREQLYEEVWAEPMTKVAARHGVSSSYLARVCATLSVPRPNRGHWAKSLVGKAPERPPLPDAPLGDSVEWSREGDATRSHVLPVLPRKPRSPRVPRQLPAVHALLSDVKVHFQSGRETDGYLRPFKRKLADVFASREGLDRAFATAQTIYDAFEVRGHRVCLAPVGSSYRRPTVDPREKPDTGHYFGPSWSPSRETVVFVGTLAIGLSLFELSERVEMVYRNGKKIRLHGPSAPRRTYGLAGYTTHDDLPSGRLCLRAYCPYGFASWTKEWRESEPGDINGRAKRIAREIYREAPRILALIEEGKHRAELEYQRWEEQHREWERQEAERQRAKALEESRSDLLTAIGTWGEANRIEQFFRDVEARVGCLSDQDERNAILERLRLGREMVGSVDALEHFRGWKAPEERGTE